MTSPARENLPDYLGVDPPDDKPLDEFDTEERRAQIAELVMAAGSDRRLNQRQLGERFGVHHTTIGRDLDAVAEDVARHLGYRAEMKVKAIFERAVDGMMENQEYREAWRTAYEFSEFLERRGALEKVPDQLNVDATVRKATAESQDYEVIEDDAAEAIEYVEAQNVRDADTEADAEGGAARPNADANADADDGGGA